MNADLKGIEGSAKEKELISMKVTMDTRLQARLIVTATGENLQELMERLVSSEFVKHREHLVAYVSSCHQ